MPSVFTIPPSLRSTGRRPRRGRRRIGRAGFCISQLHIRIDDAAFAGLGAAAVAVARAVDAPEDVDAFLGGGGGSGEVAKEQAHQGQAHQHGHADLVAGRHV